MEDIENPSGTSLLVPSVQELAKEKLSAVPPRYIQHEDLVISDADHVPVIDMQRLLSTESGTSELAKLHHACKEWGFFQVSLLLLSFFSLAIYICPFSLLFNDYKSTLT